MRILAIETSCDETAAAALQDHTQLLCSIIFSQVESHALHGGVVPELASRSHLEVLPALLSRVSEEAGIPPGGFDAYAATAGPGLAPALLVGTALARGLAAGAGKPYLPVNHLEGHLLSPFFGRMQIPPHVALVVSGGHTLLFEVREFREYRVLGRTRDDAAGEAFDKFAKLLGLGYPGGMRVEQLAASGNPEAVAFPRAFSGQPGMDFSFSGLKTAARLAIEAGGQSKEDLCASFQEAVADVLAGRLARAVRETGAVLATLSGGVSSNGRVQTLCRERVEAEGARLEIAAPALRTDNAAMIAHVAALHLAIGASTGSPRDIAPNFHPATFPALG